jgi:fatty acid desaturase
MQVRTTDPKWERPERYGAFDSFMLTALKDERDLIFVRTAAEITLVVFPIAAVLFALPESVVWWLVLPYVAALFGRYASRYGLMLHANGHRPIFDRDFDWMNRYVPWILGPFLGHTPNSFPAHHQHMHHAEGNMPEDLSTTLPYQRDHFGHFLHYWARFFFLGHIALFRYLSFRDRRKTAMSFLRGELAWLAVVVLAWNVNPAAATAVFIVPFLAMRWFLMCGNWAQHAFVDIHDPDNPYRNSNNLTNTPFNHAAYNDGYHIVHHVYPGMHWTEMAAYYEDNYQEFVEQDAVVFDGLFDNIVLWALLMTRQYDYLARHLVDLRGRTHEEKVAFLKSRVKPTLGARPAFFFFETEADVGRTKPLADAA